MKGSQEHSLAKDMSYHPTEKGDPRRQTNSTMVLKSMQHQQHVYSNPYGDGQVVMPGTNVSVMPNPQQQVIVHPPGRLPNGDNPVMPGHPRQILDRGSLERLAASLSPSQAPMGASQQRPMGDPQAAIRRGISGPMASGHDFSRVGGRRPLVM
jgi:hypothetical protein